MKTLIRLTVSLAVLAATSAHATVRYVDANSAHATPPYTSWATAARNIQDAVDAASTPGALVLVTNGVYTAGGRTVGTNLLVNRVAVDKPLTLRSVNGPQLTVIQGYQVPGTTNGDSAIRCVYLADGASLSGFTLTNGATRNDGEWEREQSGGGAWCERAAVVSNCVLSGNSAGAGGGAYGGTLNNCTLTGNRASSGGGVYGATLDNCVLSGNSASDGGGASGGTLNNCTISANSAASNGGGVYGGGLYNCTLNNCTLTGNAAGFNGGGACRGTLQNCALTDNSAASNGGGAYGGTLNNCIAYFNTAPGEPNCANSTLNYCCTTPLPQPWQGGSGNITDAPLFVDYAGGNLHLQSNSPCINAGNNAYAPGPSDLEGLPRIVNGTVDIGAYEFQGSGSVISYAWLQQYGLPTDGSADAADPDADGHNTWQEWRCLTDPTNALSVLLLLSTSPDGSNVTVRWQSVAGMNYFLERSTNLSATPPFTPLATRLPGQAGTTTYTDTNAATAPRFFYRVGVQ